MSSDQTQSASGGSTLLAKAKAEALEWAKVLGFFVPAFFLLTFFVFEQRVIPSESMVPSLQVGDRVITNKMAYGFSRYSIPWGLDRLVPLGKGRVFGKTPEHGDVVVFMHPHWRRVMIKRVMGLPGDRVEVRGERIYLNGKALESEFRRRVRYIPHRRRSPVTASEYADTIGEKTFLRHEWAKGQPGDDTVIFEVPEGYLFVMGDNRDNSKDARDLSGHCPPVNGVVDRVDCRLRADAESASVGFVPIDNVIGRAEMVLWTVHRCSERNGLDCPDSRLWKSL